MTTAEQAADHGLDPAASQPGPQASLPGAKVFTIWATHLLSLTLPVSTLIFLWTGPHPWYYAPLFILPVGVMATWDSRPIHELSAPDAALPAWPFDALLWALAALHMFTIYSLVNMFESQAVFSLDMVLAFVLVGVTSGFSIVTAHELIHRRSGWERQLGRLLLCTVMYEHFYTEHIRGHHVRVGTFEDPATARFGETYGAFWRRTVPAQFKSAWRLETKRLGDVDMSPFNIRILGSRVLHGMLVSLGMATAAFVFFGLSSLVAFLVQAYVAVRVLEAVNYFEHWGLVRRGKRVQPVDSWDTHSWLTFHTLTGLSRHADHHAFASRPFQQLRVWEEAPIMPAGYIAMGAMVLGRNVEFVAAASRELKRLGLGPFSEDATAPEKAALLALEREHTAGQQADRKPVPAGPWGSLPVWARRLIMVPSFVAVATLASHFQMALGGDLLQAYLMNIWILVALGLMLMSRRALEARLQNKALSWSISLGLLIAAGHATDLMLV